MFAFRRLGSAGEMILNGVNRNVISPSAQTSTGKWKCKLCNKQLSSKRSYDEHLNIHSESRPYQCNECDYAAASQMTLRRHVLRKHSSKKAWGYQCPYCTEQYMEPASYQHHVVTKHMGRSATFGCPFSECSFKTKSSKSFRVHCSRHVIPYPDGTPRQPLVPDDASLVRFLVNDDCGAGFGRRLRQPIIHRVKDVTSVARGLISHCSSAVNSKHRCQSSCTVTTINVDVASSALQRRTTREVHARPCVSLFEDVDDDELMKAPLNLSESYPKKRSRIEVDDDVIPAHSRCRPIRRKVEPRQLFFNDHEAARGAPVEMYADGSTPEEVIFVEEDHFELRDSNGNVLNIADARPDQIVYVPSHLVIEEQPTSSRNMTKTVSAKSSSSRINGQIDFDLD
ncbi:hypothetical protein QR680_005202 [Steinernema hermaphroditum]|uniref:C2H2-type domain-containing protein n=1 Tax=Steinernema hermaphroditum TaxID=289476 RepID=A0AA39HTI1_9BILA|nr:hypothetical protein QR680_005202 [Steinernema hermaphroditum]